MSGQKNGGFAALVHSAMEGKKAKGDKDDGEDTANKAPSKGLPATGLKKNTDEYKNKVAEKKERKKQNGGPRASPTPSRQSSSSSIPSNADGSQDPRTGDERRHDQEGPAGRGPGGHEPDLRLNDGPMHDSPQSERHAALPSIPAPRGSAGDGTATPVPPEYFRDNAQEDIPDRSVRKAAMNDDPKGKGKGRQQDINGHDSDFDPEEHVESRTSGQNRKMTDEVGRLPEGLQGVKPEAPPGSQNEIILAARLPDIHVSRLYLSDPLPFLGDLS